MIDIIYKQIVQHFK